MLSLYWDDINKNSYHIANLDKVNGIYILDILEDNLKKAARNGCMGIGEIDLLKNHYESKELFTFFKQRIPSEESVSIKEILDRANLEKYDEMELLKKTSGRVLTDRYYLIYQ